MPERLVGVLGGEAELAPQVRDELAQTVPVVVAVRDGDETAARPKHPGELADAQLDVGHVVEHPGGDRAVERLVLERQLLHVADDRVDPPRAGQLHHPR
jgi:hypothetical protein